MTEQATMKIDGVPQIADMLASNVQNDTAGLTPGANVAEAIESLQANVDSANATVMQLVNNSGAAQSTGALVKLGAVAQSFDVTVIPGDPDALYVLMADTANGAPGLVAVSGAVTVAVSGAVAIGDMLGASATAGYAETRTSGVGFGVALTANVGGLGVVEVTLATTNTASLSDFAIIANDRASTQAGGSCGATTTQTRPLNVVRVAAPWVALSGNAMTIDTDGDYLFEARAPAYEVDEHNIIIRNTSDAVDEIVGSNALALASDNAQTDSFLRGVITVSSAPKVYELQHYTTLARTAFGFGLPINSGRVEVYAEVIIWRLP